MESPSKSRAFFLGKALALFLEMKKACIRSDTGFWNISSKIVLFDISLNVFP
jgi:hypothetical protein